MNMSGKINIGKHRFEQIRPIHRYLRMSEAKGRDGIGTRSVSVVKFINENEMLLLNTLKPKTSYSFKTKSYSHFNILNILTLYTRIQCQYIE